MWCLHNIINVLNATELCPLTWLNLCEFHLKNYFKKIFEFVEVLNILSIAKDLKYFVLTELLDMSVIILLD